MSEIQQTELPLKVPKYKIVELRKRMNNGSLSVAKAIKETYLLIGADTYDDILWIIEKSLKNDETTKKAEGLGIYIKSSDPGKDSLPEHKTLAELGINQEMMIDFFYKGKKASQEQIMALMIPLPFTLDQIQKDIKMAQEQGSFDGLTRTRHL